MSKFSSVPAYSFRRAPKLDVSGASSDASRSRIGAHGADDPSGVRGPGGPATRQLSLITRGSHCERRGEKAGCGSFDRAARQPRQREEGPGPGAYDVRFPADVLGNKGVRIGKSTRFLNAASPYQAAPALYEIPHSIPDVPAYNYPPLRMRKIRL